MDGQVTAIELQGIVRNRTKIGVEDGQAEDLLNLRFVDGSWRTSGDGRRIEWTMGDVQYEQLYIHTNIYRHLLGVNPKDKKLYWFANIAKDNVTFTPLATPIALTSVEGDIWITQTGHLLTVIDEADNFEYFVFHTSEDKYVQVVVDENGKQTDRGIYPFGQVRLNCYCPCDNEHIYGGKDVEAYFQFGVVVYYDAIKGVIKKKNQFAQPFAAIIAAKLYDGSYAFVSAPIIIHPRENFNNLHRYNKGFFINDFADGYLLDNKVIVFQDGATIDRYLSGGENNNVGVEFLNEIDIAQFPTIKPYGNSVTDEGNITFNDSFDSNKTTPESGFINYFQRGSSHYISFLGSDLTISIDTDTINKAIANKDVITSLCIFVTPEVDIYKSREKDEIINVEGLGDITYPQGTLQWSNHATLTYKYHSNANTVSRTITYTSRSPEYKTNEKIVHDLMNSPFYLLREYRIQELSALLTNPIVDLSTIEYDGLLTNITQQDTLKIEASNRLTYLPKYSYNYNGRLHIANYKTRQFHGYPIDLFQLHNHSVKVESGSWFKGVLRNLADNNDEYLQYTKAQYNFPETYASNAEYFAFISVEIDTDDGVQRVVRYIEPYNINPAVNGRADFVEALNPLLTFPDYRAKSMFICVYTKKENSTNYSISVGAEFKLKPHPLYNFAYYIDPNLKPIKLTPIGSTFIPPLRKEQNVEEYFPNGLKVTKTDNPMVFPAENAYQIGSGEILAMCSNTVAVGTGQTGAAPLYVFCSDGVYALFVDSSGEMTYTNARAIARDVLNNPRSVTPIDEGVVFTTDRGLMMIAGEQVKEIGQPAEGDVLQYFNIDSVDSIKIADGALKEVGGFIDEELCDKTDFLTYLKGAIINYNHNERELMVSNPQKSYSYIMDRNGNWSRRDYTADEYVNNYPTSYRLQDGVFYKVDEEGDNDTPLEEKKEADNKFFYLSNIIKLGSIGFKQGARFVVRGFFSAKPASRKATARMKSYYNTMPHTIYVKSDWMDYPNVEKIVLTYNSNYQWQDAEGKIYYLSATAEEWQLNSPSSAYQLSFYVGDTITIQFTRNYIGCYVFGSYDGRKWAMLGGNEKTGTFTDIGCKIERTDVKFLRVCLAGQMQGDSRIDYMEISSTPSVLNTKIR